MPAKAEKVQVVEELKDRLSNTKSAIFVDYRA